jgi:lipid-A-disaccharide synthase
MKKPLKVGLIAGEASGDVLGAQLMQALKDRVPDVEFVGIGGPMMCSVGLNSFVPQEQLAVRGYVEVLRHLPRLLKIRRGISQFLLAERPDVFVGIDAPDFNLAVEKTLKEAGVPTIHYVSPSIWAWREDRVKKIGQAADHVLCLFPMEVAYYEKERIPATYVGHPLASRLPLVSDRLAARKTLDLGVEHPIFAVLPGSRTSELAYMLPLYFEVMRNLFARYPTSLFLVPLATRATLLQFDVLLQKHHAWDLPIRKLIGHADVASASADVVLVTSGTASLEVALTKRPMVISYRISALTYYFVKNKIKRPVGLPNILMGQNFIPELLQTEATSLSIVEQMVALYEDKKRINDIEQGFHALHLKLKQDTNRLAVECVLKLAKY